MAITRTYTEDEERALERAVRLVYDLNAIPGLMHGDSDAYRAAAKACYAICLHITGGNIREGYALSNAVREAGEALGPLRTWTEGGL